MKTTRKPPLNENATNTRGPNARAFLGYHEASGSPLLQDLKDTMEGHLTVIGPTRSGRTTTNFMRLHPSPLGSVFIIRPKSTGK